MTTSRNAVRIERTSLFMGLLLATMLIGGARVFGLERQLYYDILLQRPLTDAPTWIGRGWFPLDFLAVAFMAYLAIHVLLSISPDTFGIVTVVKFSYALIGGMIGSIITMLGGWYIGLQVQLAFGTFLTAGMLAALGVLKITSPLEAFLGNMYQHHLSKHIAKGFGPLGRYLRAEDIPAAAEKDS